MSWISRHEKLRIVVAVEAIERVFLGLRSYEFESKEYTFMHGPQRLLDAIKVRTNGRKLVTVGDAVSRLAESLGKVISWEDGTRGRVVITEKVKP